jgi:hypothetical protein
MVHLRQVHLGQLPGRHPRRFSVQEIVKHDPVEDGFQPDLHGPGQRAGDRPAVALVLAILDHGQQQVGPPAAPARGIPDDPADLDGIGGNERLVRDLDAAHGIQASHMRGHRPTVAD